MHGRGCFQYATAAKYEVRAGPRRRERARPSSSCARATPSLSRAQGRFEMNKYNGHGTYTFPDGSFYCGPFKDNQMHGAGSFTDTQASEAADAGWESGPR